MSCSTGGRQGLYAALHHPEDFDGILACSPAANFNHLVGWSDMLTRYIGAPDANNSASFIPSQLWSVISAEILRQCDVLDGDSDGIIVEPDERFFQPPELLCDASSNKIETCFTEEQVDYLVKTYSPLYGLRGELLYSRYDPGAESGILASSIVFSRQSFPYTLANCLSFQISDDREMADE
ncbi:hypothetical protein ACEPAH_7712 [Sanghuangporus vaninii]